ncbi:PaaI family thioesterase [Terrilactibacillus sp. S3-3]|nr:PaaI family thioesterase [Terrilactibacillus sp. S3-3]
MNDERRKIIVQTMEKALLEANDNELAAIERLLSAITDEHLAKATTYMNSLMDYHGEQVDENAYNAEITIHPFIMNSLNIVHGGIIATLADTAMGTLVHAAAPEGKTGVTSDYQAQLY